MKLNRFLKQAGFAGMLGWLVVGCTGINQSRSLAPVDFLMPGSSPWLRLLNGPVPGPLDLLTNSVSSRNSVLAQR